MNWTSQLKKRKAVIIALGVLVTIVVMATAILIPPPNINVNGYSSNALTDKGTQFSEVNSDSTNPVRAMSLDNQYLYSSSPVQTVAQARVFLKSIGNPDYVYVRPARVYDGNPGVLTVMSLNFASLIHAASSTTKVLSIVDINTDNSSSQNNYYGLNNNPDFSISDIYCDLSNASNRNTLVETMSQVVNYYGFDGVYLDIEPLMSGTTWLPQMIQEFKALTDGKTVVVYGFSLVNDSQADGYGWSASYLKSVCSVADYVELRLYNFNSTTIDAYQAEILNQIARVESANLTSKILFVLPVFPASPIHDPSIENIANAGPLVQTFNTGLFSQAYMTQNDYAEYLALFGK